MADFNDLGKEVQIGAALPARRGGGSRSESEGAPVYDPLHP
jgi:hypothetical protein